MQLRAIFLLPILLALMIFPELALAQNIFDPLAISPNDKSMKILAAMFGKLGAGTDSVFGPSPTDVFVASVLAFNSAVLTIGGILVAYTILIGTIGTAHDGEMLGKKFSSAWVPIRTAAGTSLVLPVIGGGYCIMQLIVGWLIVQGIGLANLVWSTYMSPSNLNETVSVNVGTQDAEKVAWGLFSNMACMYAYENIYNKLKSDPNTSSTVSPSLAFGPSSNLVPGVDPSTVLNTGTNSFVQFYGASSPGDGFGRSACGSIVLGSAEINLDNLQLNTDLLNRQEIKTAIATAEANQKNAVTQLVNQMLPVAKSFADNPSNINGTVASVKSVANAYAQSSVSSAANITSLIGNFDQLSQASRNDGWVLAGAWYIRMSYLMEIAGKVASRQPTVQSPSFIGVGEEKYKDIFLKEYKESFDSLLAMGASVSGVADVADDQSKNIHHSGASSKIDSMFKEAFGGASKMFSLNPGDHPIMAMKNLGNTIITIVGTAITTIGLTLLGGGSIPFVGNGVQAASSLVIVIGMVIFAPMIAIGFTLSYVLPMMPFMIWIGVVIGWVVLCVQAIIAAPMWAVMHLSPNGDDMVGTGAQGYRLVLSLMLRPVLMIFGLIAALSIITVLGKFINEVFASILVLSQQDSNFMVLMVGMLAAPFLYAGIMWTLITKTMDIVHVIPDQLLEWFGGGGPQIGDYGRTFGDKNSQAFAATAAVAGIAGRGIDMAKGVKDLNLQKKQTNAAEESKENDKLSRVSSSFLNGTGSSNSSILSKLSGSSSSSGQENYASSADGVAASSAMNDAVTKLGGPSADASSDYMESLSANINNGDSFGDAHQKAMISTMNTHFGEQQAKYVSDATGGKFGTQGTKEKFREAMANVASVNNMHKEDPPHVRKDAAEEIFGKVNSASGGISENTQGAFKNVIGKHLEQSGISSASSSTDNVATKIDPNQTSLDFGDQTSPQSGGKTTSQD